ncbi:MAG: hypothetical protein DRG83_04095, partial [Deltaproteobacteria bacterium]
MPIPAQPRFAMIDVHRFLEGRQLFQRRKRDRIYGHYDEKKREYVITDLDTPRPWLNFLSNDVYCAIVSQIGEGYSAFRRLNGWPITHFYSEKYYVPREFRAGRHLWCHDVQTGRTWSFRPSVTEPPSGRCRHGLGYTVLESSSEGIRSEWTIIVPAENVPIELWNLRLINTGAGIRTLYIFPFVQWYSTAYPFGEDYYYHYFTEAQYHPDLQAVVTGEVDSESCLRFRAFMTIDHSVLDADCDYDAFMGGVPDGEIPIAVQEGTCRGSYWAKGRIVAALRVSVSVPADSEVSVRILLGVLARDFGTQPLGDYRDIICDLKERYLTPASTRVVIKHLSEYWDKVIHSSWVKTPDPVFNRFVNVHLKYQLHQTKRFTRSGQRGFRDVFQDMRSFVPIDPSSTARYLRLGLRYQYRNGRAVRVFGEYDGSYLDMGHNDSPIWVPATLAAYVKETGDTAILEEKVPFLDGGQGTIYEHVLRAVRYLFDHRG